VSAKREAVPETFNVYCDESCHLELDGQPAMTLGAVWCPLSHARPTAERLREIKLKHGLKPLSEVKWTKLSPGNLPLYLDLLDYFFDAESLSFRCVVADKGGLRHGDYAQTHDDWYYKMYFTMLHVIMEPQACFRIYLDIKDTRSAVKVRKLHDVLANSLYDFSRSIVERVQTVRSHEVELLQLADILIGSVSAANRGEPESPAKRAFIERMRHRSGYTLTRTTLLREKKLNIFHWRGTS
jgi:hypothetical protein